jgi:hypothetical protein
LRMGRKCTGVLVLSVVLVVSVSAAFAAEVVKVITREDAIRASCRFFAPVVASVRYNDVLEVLSREGDWYRVRFNDVEGCIHKSAVEQQKISLAGLKIGGGGTASEDEVALAGKGFNPQVEEAYKSENPELAYQSVDQVEAYAVEVKRQITFIEEGRLNLP